MLDIAELEQYFYGLYKMVWFRCQFVIIYCFTLSKSQVQSDANNETSHLVQHHNLTRVYKLLYHCGSLGSNLQENEQNPKVYSLQFTDCKVLCFPW